MFLGIGGGHKGKRMCWGGVGVGGIERGQEKRFKGLSREWREAGKTNPFR